MRETLTILWDSLKLLLARKLFWIVMGVSLLVGLVYASIGFNDTGITAFFGLAKIPNELVTEGSDFAKMFYLILFTSIINPYWLGFLAIVLALIASCSVFPELMKEGSIETLLSKPVRRSQIFFVKYFGMLAFMAIPLAAFCIIAFLAMGWRVGVWKLEIFYAVPILTFVFSILYSFAVLVGVWTRSTLFSLLATLFFWGGCFLVHSVEFNYYTIFIQHPQSGIVLEEGLESSYHEEAFEPEADKLKFYNRFRSFTAAFPKPRKATLMLREILIFDEELGPLAGVSFFGLLAGIPEEGVMREASASKARRMTRAEILIPSALFQVATLGLGCWFFVRRDF